VLEFLETRLATDAQRVAVEALHDRTLVDEDVAPLSFEDGFGGARASSPCAIESVSMKSIESNLEHDRCDIRRVRLSHRLGAAGARATVEPHRRLELGAVVHRGGDLRDVCLDRPSSAAIDPQYLRKSRRDTPLAARRS
jgi:hypothetical protein